MYVFGILYAIFEDSKIKAITMNKKRESRKSMTTEWLNVLNYLKINNVYTFDCCFSCDISPYLVIYTRLHQSLEDSPSNLSTFVRHRTLSKREKNFKFDKIWCLLRSYNHIIKIYIPNPRQFRVLEKMMSKKQIPTIPVLPSQHLPVHNEK